MAYAIISLGGKQYRVSEGEKLLVDRLREDEGATLTLAPLLVGGDGDAELAPDGVAVTARVVRHVLGEKVRIGKYKPKSGYRRHTGHRSRLSQIEIQSIAASASGSRSSRRRAAPDVPAPAQDEAPPAAAEAEIATPETMEDER